MLENKIFLDELSKYKPKILHTTALEAAVMLILLTDEKDPMHIVVTKRSTSLPTYAGHYSFPGGMRDADDANLYATAKRETQEELNLPPDAYQYIGQLDDFQDHDSNLVRPFVTIMKKKDFKKLHKESPDEISGIYYFSLSKLHLIADEPRLHSITRRRPSYAFTEEDVFIWGLTATILVHFYNVIAKKNMPLGKTMI